MKTFGILCALLCLAAGPVFAEAFYWDGGDGAFEDITHWRQRDYDQEGFVFKLATRVPTGSDQTYVFSDGINAFTVNANSIPDLTMIYLGSNGASATNLVFNSGTYYLRSSLILGLVKYNYHLDADPENDGQDPFGYHEYYDPDNDGVYDPPPVSNVNVNVLSGAQLEVHNAIDIGGYGAAQFHQYGGTVDNSDPANAFMSIGNDEYSGDDVPNPGIAEYYLHDGLLKTHHVYVEGEAMEAHFYQSGGVHIASDFIYVGGNGNKDVAGRYFLDGGRLEANRVNLNWEGKFDQTGGEAFITRLEVQGQHGVNYPSVYTLSNGDLSVTNEFIGYQTWGEFAELTQTGGMHSVNNLHVGYMGGKGTVNLYDGVLQSQNDEQLGESTSYVYNNVIYWYGGTGRFNQSGGDHTANGTVEIGRNPGAWGKYTLSDGQLTAASLALGREGGTGIFLQSGGRADISSDTWIGNGLGDAATLDLQGGEYHGATIYNYGQMNYSGGTLYGNIYSNGNIAVSGAGTRTIHGSVYNWGVFKTTNTSLVVTGNYIEAGTFVSDPSNNKFNGNLTVEGNGVLQGGAGDVFDIGGNLNVTTANTAGWNTALAALVFSGSGPHALTLSGADWEDKFAWHSMTLNGTGQLNLLLGTNALYLDEFSFNGNPAQLGDFTGTVFLKSLFVNGTPFALPGQPDASGWYKITDPSVVTPEPLSASLFLLGGGFIALRKLRRKN